MIVLLSHSPYLTKGSSKFKIEECQRNLNICFYFLYFYNSENNSTKILDDKDADTLSDFQQAGSSDGPKIVSIISLGACE